MGRINSMIQIQAEVMQDNTVESSRSNNLFINLISFISIGMITFIGIFTFPMLGKIEDRKISVLKFFNLLNIEQIQELIKKGEEYQEEFSGL
jgi:cytochrome c biogenesis factor